jgi:hypothetical protein
MYSRLDAGVPAKARFRGSRLNTGWSSKTPPPSSAVP